MYLGPCTQHRLVVGAELLSSMQHNESEVSDCELIVALEAYESHEAPHVKDKKMLVLETGPSLTSNYLLQHRGWKTISNSEM